MWRTRTLVAGAAAVCVCGTAGVYGVVAFETRDAPGRARLADSELTATASGSAPGTVDGRWILAPSSTDFVGYRMRERVAGIAAPNDVVGRTTAMTGDLRIGGGRIQSGEVRVDMTTVSTGVGPRDSNMRTAGLETSTFPTATFRVDRPVPLGNPAPGHVVRLDLPGTLTLHGVTRPQTFKVSGRWNGPTLQIAGTVRIRLSDYGIDVLSLVSFRIDKTGEIEFQLTYRPAARPSGTPSAAPPLARDRGTTGDPFDVPTELACSTPPPAPIKYRLAAATGDAIVTQRPDGTDRSSVAVAGPVENVDWSSRSAITYTVPPQQETQVVRIDEIPAAARTPRPMPRGRLRFDGALSPDGRTLAYVAQDGDVTAVYTEPVAGGPPVRVSPDGAQADGPAWSPDGRTLAFTINDGPGNDDIAVAPARGGAARRVAATGAYEYAPAWAPDGRSLAFISDGAIRVVGADGKHRIIVDESRHDAEPHFSPDGAYVSFYRSGNVYLDRVAGGSPACIPFGAAVTSGAPWEPAR
jgi:polyisoprenoid-binding protein YceI